MRKILIIIPLIFSIGIVGFINSNNKEAESPNNVTEIGKGVKEDSNSTKKEKSTTNEKISSDATDELNEYCPSCGAKGYDGIYCRKCEYQEIHHSISPCPNCGDDGYDGIHCRVCRYDN